MSKKEMRNVKFWKNLKTGVIPVENLPQNVGRNFSKNFAKSFEKLLNHFLEDLEKFL